MITIILVITVIFVWAMLSINIKSYAYRVAYAAVLAAVTFLSLFILTGCSADVPQQREENALKLPLFWEQDISDLMNDFNDISFSQRQYYFMWRADNLTAEEITARNAALTENTGVIPICIMLQPDGSIFALSDENTAAETAAELNRVNTNAYSRIIFMIDSLGYQLLNTRISVYDADKDIFRGQ